MYPIKNIEELENLNELVFLGNLVKAVRLQDNPGKQNFHENIKKVFEPDTNTIKNTSEEVTKSITETSIKNSETLDNLNEKVLEQMNDKGMIAPYLASSLVNLFTLENTSQFKLREDPNSNRMNDFLINGVIPVSLYSKMLTFRDGNKPFKLDGDLLETTKLYDFFVSNSNPQDRKLNYEFGKEMKYNIKQKGRKYPLTSLCKCLIE